MSIIQPATTSGSHVFRDICARDTETENRDAHVALPDRSWSGVRKLVMIGSQSTDAFSSHLKALS